MFSLNTIQDLLFSDENTVYPWSISMAKYLPNGGYFS